MNALRLARHGAPSAHLSRAVTSCQRFPASSVASTSNQSVIPLSNVEAQWEKLSQEEQVAVHRELEQLQKKDWKELSIDQKKAAYYVAFGPHGPRTPISKPGDTSKVILGTAAALGVSVLAFMGTRALASPPPKTINKEWQEAATERAKEKRINPISGVSSEGYKGKGFVDTK